MFMVGSSGAGKTTLAEMLAREQDFMLLSEDVFIFDMNPRTKIARRLRDGDRELGMGSLWTTLRMYLEAGRSVVVEGAFVDGPYYLNDFRKLASECGYEFVPILLDGSARKRRKRKKRQGYAIPQEVDLRLRRSAERLGYWNDCAVVDTTKDRTKRKSLERIIAIVNG